MTGRFRFYYFLVLGLMAILVRGQISVVTFRKDTIDQSISLSVRNELPAPIQFQLRFDKFNLAVDTLLFPETEFVQLFRIPLEELPDSIPLSDLLRTNALVGDPLVVHDNNVRYQLPFQKRKKYILIQGFGGKFSHSSDHSRYALDFAMDEGEEVRAARGGVVCYYQEHFSEGGPDREEYLNKGNRLMILHEDGTIGTYNHLKQDGVLVEIGQRVNTGDLIALSGNTGFSTRPHLHFVVRVCDTSVPVVFEKIKQFKKGKKYGR